MSKTKIKSREEIEAEIDQKGATNLIIARILLDIRELLKN